MIKKELLFSITKKDFDFQFYKGSGAGGQKRNKTENCCRVVHKLSGASGKSEDERSKNQNTKLAFNRCVNSKKFQSFLKLETAARLQGWANAEAKVKDMMKEENLKIETYSPEE